MRGIFAVPLAAAAFAGGAVGVLALRSGANITTEFEGRRDGLVPGPEGEPLMEAAIAHLPDPVQRYIRRAGAVGKVACDDGPRDLRCHSL